MQGPGFGAKFLAGLALTTGASKALPQEQQQGDLGDLRTPAAAVDRDKEQAQASRAATQPASLPEVRESQLGLSERHTGLKPDLCQSIMNARWDGKVYVLSVQGKIHKPSTIDGELAQRLIDNGVLGAQFTNHKAGEGVVYIAAENNQVGIMRFQLGMPPYGDGPTGWARAAKNLETFLSQSLESGLKPERVLTGLKPAAAEDYASRAARLVSPELYATEGSVAILKETGSLGGHLTEEVGNMARRLGYVGFQVINYADGMAVGWISLGNGRFQQALLPLEPPPNTGKFNNSKDSTAAFREALHRAIEGQYRSARRSEDAALLKEAAQQPGAIFGEERP